MKFSNKFINYASLLRITLLCHVFVKNCESAKILGVFHLPGRSQYVLGEYLLKQLALRGHEVTMLSPLPDLDEPTKNFRNIVIDSGGLQLMNSTAIARLLSGKSMNVYQKLSVMLPAFHEFGQSFIESSDLHDFLNTNQEFDLVIQLFIMNEAMLGIGHHFKAPTIGFCTVGASQYINHMFANPSPYSMVPNIFLASTETFWQRLENALSTFAFEMIQQLWSIPQQERLLKTHFPKAPPLEQLMDEMRIVLMNSHPAIEGSIPYMPNMIQIGGFHTSAPEPLPINFQEFMDKSPQGVILFSLGSNIKPSTFTKDRIKSILKNLGSLEQKVILKFDGPLENVPRNIMVSKWVPQTSILAHKNIKAFVTHSGLGGTAEAIYNAVPMVCIPFFGDQNKNAEDTVRNGYGVKMAVQELDGDTLARSIMEVVKNPIYLQKISATSDFYRSQPIRPLENAIYWIEHVIRHKGASHFPKSIGTKQSLVQYLLLDVLALVGVIVLTVFMILYYSIKLGVNYICKCFRLKCDKKKGESKVKSRRNKYEKSVIRRK